MPDELRERLQPQMQQQQRESVGRVGLYTAAVEVGPDGITINGDSIKAEELKELGLESGQVRKFLQLIGDRAKIMLGGDPEQAPQFQVKVNPPPHPNARNW